VIDMTIRLFNLIEITILTRRERVRRALRERGVVGAVNLCRKLYGYGLKEAHDFVRCLEQKKVDRS